MPHTPRNVQPPYTVNSFRDYLAEDVLTLAVCWLLEAKDGTRIGATSHVRDLTLPGHVGVVFTNNQGVTPSAVDSETEGESAGLEVEAVFDSELITEETVAAGKWRSAKFEIFVINYKEPGMGELIMHSGTLGDVTTRGAQFKAQAEPLTAKARTKIGNLCRARCDVRRLGDERCKVDITEPADGDGGVITVAGSVTGGDDSQLEFVDATRVEAVGYFTHGEVEFTSGALAGQRFEVKDFAAGRFTLHVPTPRPIAQGTMYTAIRGCDRTAEMCRVVYANIINFRGFPHVPGVEKALRIERASV